jgi:hypothetical protein
MVYEHDETTGWAGDTLPPGTRRNVGRRRCNLERPLGVPAGAAYRGTGVCEDERDRPLPCSLFEHAAARQPEALRYFVYYVPDGRGVRRIDAVSAGRNEHALEAELAFQIGRALQQAGCCRDRAEAYLLHAAALFPDDEIYRAAVAAVGRRDTRTASNPMAGLRPVLDLSP